VADDGHTRQTPSRRRFSKVEGATLMISEHIAIQDQPTRPAARTWRLVVAALPKAAILTFTSGVMRRQREYFEPDPFATEAPSSMTVGLASDRLAENLCLSGWHTLSRSRGSMATTRTARVAVIGGLTAARALLRRGLEVSVYETAPELKEIGAGVASCTAVNFAL